MHRKGAQDAKRAKVFGKFLRDISVAIREGGGTDLTTNGPLRTAVARAKQANVPNVNIDRLLKGTQDDAAVYESVRYEGIGPEGSAFIIELITDNRNRSACDIRTIFNRHGVRLADSNSVTFRFERKGMIIYDTEGICQDTLMMHAIEEGAQDVEAEGTSGIIFCELEALHKIASQLEHSFCPAKEVQAVWWPHEWIHVQDTNALETIEKFRCALDQNEDVQNVWDNVSSEA